MSSTRSGSTPTPNRRTSPKGTPLVVALAVLVCVAAIVAIMLALRDDDAPAAMAGTGCEEAPPPPATPQTFDSAPQPALAENAKWEATLATNCGDITLELDGTAAPQTVASFIFLAREGYFDASPCHRLTTSGLFVLQCGDPTGKGTGSPGYGFGIENAPENGEYPTGSVAMARSEDPDSNGSQFFIVYDDTNLPTDGGGYTIFGRVTDGLEVVNAIAEEGVDGSAGDGAPKQPISILGVELAQS